MNGSDWLLGSAWANGKQDEWNRLIDWAGQENANTYGTVNYGNNIKGDPRRQWAVDMANAGRRIGTSTAGYDANSLLGQFAATARSNRSSLTQAELDASGKFLPGANGYGGFGGNAPDRSEDEITQAYNAFKSPDNAAFTGAYQNLISGMREQSRTANDAYRQTQLGGNYAGGVLPDSGYRDTMRMGGLGGLGGMAQPGQAIAPQPQPQVTWGQPAAQPQSPSGGLGGLGGWGGPFSNNNPWAAA